MVRHEGLTTSQSMIGRIESGQLWTVAPIDPGVFEVGVDRVRGRQEATAAFHAQALAAVSGGYGAGWPGPLARIAARVSVGRDSRGRRFMLSSRFVGLCGAFARDRPVQHCSW